MIEESEKQYGSDSDKQSELLKERGREERYRKYVEHRAAHPIGPDGPRSGQFVGWLIPEAKPAPDVQFEGRVALVMPDEQLGHATEFYLGRAYGCVDGIDVYNWRSPFGRLFFEGNWDSTRTPNVACIRSFVHRNSELTDFTDEILCESPPLPIFGRGGADMSAQEGRVLEATPQLPVSEDNAAVSNSTAEATRHGGKSAHRGKPPASDDKVSQVRFRAESLLRDRLRAPRTEKLIPVLSTMQPEQYRLVIARTHDSAIIEGGPGTGKTIIASHRAAYFIGPDTAHPAGLEGNVLVIGPTAEYGKYIEDVIRQLVGEPGRIKVCTFAELEKLLLNDSSADVPRVTPWPERVKTSLEELVREAKEILTNGLDTKLTVPQIYEFVRTNGRPERRLTTESAWEQYLSTLPVPSEVKPSGPRPWLLALIEYMENTDSKLPRIDHVIVDEAQDVKPTEWSILRSINLGKGWTILGDLNQRRDDQTSQDWSEVWSAIGLPEKSPHQLRHGYRSTVPILNFAAKLLPKSAEPPLALQAAGPAPVIVSSSPESLPGAVAQQVRRLCSRYPEGTIAVITTTPGPFNHLSSSDVIVLTVDKARGLEFDAVIVVEPADFPYNDHRRYGPLYTALTRPNRELVVVYAKSMPHQLQATPRWVGRSAAGMAEPTAVKKDSKSKRPRRLRFAKAARRRRGNRDKKA